MYQISSMQSNQPNNRQSRLDEKYVKQLVSLLHQNFGNTIPAVLWHYTSVDAAEKILAGNSLLFTHVSELNDYTEVEFAANISRDCLDQWLAVTTIEDWQRRLLDVTRKSLLTRNSESTWYTFSLSSVRDDLSQWRAYGQQGYGVALGFNAQELIRFLSESPANRPLVLPVSYDIDLVRQFGDGIIRLMIENFETDFGAEETQIETFLKQWGRHVDAFSILPKQHHFSSEREWRFAIQPKPVGAALMQQQFGGKKRMLVGQGKIHDSKDTRLPVVEIIHGPISVPNRKERIHLAISDRNMDEISISDSAIPLRP